MKNESCPISCKTDSKKYTINCAGEKVYIDDTGFTSRCAIGNTEDYLKSFENHINSEFISLGDPALISVVVPSYASEEEALGQILISLCSQKYPVSAEILVFINESENVTENVRMINDRNESFVRSIENGASKDISDELLKAQKLLVTTLAKTDGNVTLKCVRQIISGGLAGVYQTVTVSLAARVRYYCDSIMTGYNRQERIKCIEKYFQDSMLLLCDDDMEIKDAYAVSKAYEAVVKKDTVILGKLYIKSVDTAKEYNNILRDLMQLFFDFKYDKGLNFLTPRGIVLADVLNVGGVNVGQPFADQLFFASMASAKKQYLIDASTSIAESDYPGNGNFLKELRLYLQGTENDALDIFENVLHRYKEDNHKGKYCADDIEKLILILKTRDISRISLVAAELLRRNR